MYLGDPWKLRATTCFAKVKVFDPQHLCLPYGQKFSRAEIFVELIFANLVINHENKFRQTYQILNNCENFSAKFDKLSIQKKYFIKPSINKKNVTCDT